MRKMKKTGALAVICLLALQLAAGAVIPLLSNTPQDPLSVTETAAPTQSRPEIEREPEPEAPSTDTLQTTLQDPPQTTPAVTEEPVETTDEIQVGGYEGVRTDPDDDPAAPAPSQSEETDPAVPETEGITTDTPVESAPATESPVTESPVTDAPVTDVPETEPVETLPPEAPPVSPEIEDQGGLLNIDNPDPNYGFKVVNVTGSERTLLEALVMGEAGNQGYIGAALVAQCIKDAMVYEGYKSVAEVRSKLKYTGSISYAPNEDVKKAVAYVFDEGGYAVQHPILFFYYIRNGLNMNGFHETQMFIIQYKDHRFFWKKN